MTSGRQAKNDRSEKKKRGRSSSSARGMKGFAKRCIARCAQRMQRTVNKLKIRRGRVLSPRRELSPQPGQTPPPVNFNQLPYVIRLMIWRAAINDPRVVEISRWCDPRRKPSPLRNAQSEMLTPETQTGILDANHESKAETLRFYEVEPRRSAYDKNGGLPNAESDNLHVQFDEDLIYYFHQQVGESSSSGDQITDPCFSLHDSLRSGEARLVKHLVIPAKWRNEAELWKSSSLGDENIVVFRYFSNLKTLCLLGGGGLQLPPQHISHCLNDKQDPRLDAWQHELVTGQEFACEIDDLFDVGQVSEASLWDTSNIQTQQILIARQARDSAISAFAKMKSCGPSTFVLPPIEVENPHYNPPEVRAVMLFGKGVERPPGLIPFIV
jgi:hypothetical protein